MWAAAGKTWRVAVSLFALSLVLPNSFLAPYREEIAIGLFSTGLTLITALPIAAGVGAGLYYLCKKVPNPTNINYRPQPISQQQTVDRRP
jgi:hypothetical protein